MGVVRQASASCILQSRIPCSLPHKKHTSTLFASCPHLTWPHYVSDRSLNVIACKWLCSQAKALMSSASLHHRVPSLYLLKIGHGSPSRAYLRGYRKLEEKTGGVLSIKLPLDRVLLLLVLLLEHGERCECCYLGALRHLWPLS